MSLWVPGDDAYQRAVDYLATSGREPCVDRQDLDRRGSQTVWYHFPMAFEDSSN